MIILSAIDGTHNGMLTLMLVLAATGIMVVLLRRRQFRSTSRRESTRDHIARVRDEHKLHDAMGELLLELEEVSRRVGAQIETRYAKLEAVMRDADARIAHLEQLRGARPAGAAHVVAEPGAPASGGTEPRASAGGRSRAVDGGDGDPARSGPEEAADPRFRRVYELVDAGATPIKAAEELGMPLGEVELILNLRAFR